MNIYSYFDVYLLTYKDYDSIIIHLNRIIIHADKIIIIR